jgi:hypothetical protein
MIPEDIQDEYLVGKRVQITNKTNLLFMRLGTVVGVLSALGRIQVELDGESGITFWDYEELSIYEGKPKSLCECGCAAVGSPFHSWYCPLHSPNPYD